MIRRFAVLINRLRRRFVTLVYVDTEWNAVPDVNNDADGEADADINADAQRGSYMDSYLDIRPYNFDIFHD